MAKRILSLLLTLALLFSAAPAVFAEDARQTDFFMPREHADLDFADMRYEAVDVDSALAQMDAVRLLASNPGNLEAVKAGVLKSRDSYILSETMAVLAYIRSSLDYTDDAAAAAEVEAEEAVERIYDGFMLLLRDVLASPCAAALDEFLTEDEAAALAYYEALTEEDLDRSNRISTLEQEYWTLAGQTYSAEYDGRTWTSDAADDAYTEGEITYDDYVAITRAVAASKNQVLGAHYLKMAALYREEAAANGYDDFADYAYQLLWQREYSKEEIRVFHAAVKKYITPVLAELEPLYYAALSSEAFEENPIGDAALDMMEPLVAEMSDELYESFRYMRDHGLYDIGISENKKDMGYTTLLPAYAAPFFYDCPYQLGPADLITAVHEFGHYNAYYWTEPDWFGDVVPLDLAEVHSQALELLFTEFYPRLFGAASEDVLVFKLYNLLYNIVDGALQDELQQFVFSAPDVTLDQINEKYCELRKEYGVIEADDPRTEMYGWVDISHTFVEPFYYISYAVSASGAFSFWLDARENGFYHAVDDYLRFTALGSSCGFEASFAAVGISSPLTSDYLEALSEKLIEVLDTLYALPFSDVTEDDWFFDAVDFVWQYGIMAGTEDTLFLPGESLTRGMAVTILWRLFSGEEYTEKETGFTDVSADLWYASPVAWAVENQLVLGYEDGSFRPDREISREEFAAILYRAMQQSGIELEAAVDAPLDYADADRVSAYADEAMRWMVTKHIIQGYDNGTLAPQSMVTRAEAAVMILNLNLALSDPAA